ncbi:succinylglutamate desuccinylase/aspartoacylase domain-containing protein [Lacimicrobium alkaliphilum]|uniref:Succinylglutamate desuccinylase/Aspartoacylase catalytic domain-containing protein n=1 Tax=Lacimicrobium alkaliphilum TaxID=1526571 RepID=A0A0U3AH54_9ALTE|nr:succinylglutamate desuccinylase/aspartoacylase family protein [Lacimicrobium alkaliphilum]ALS98033.1 hypothetical protein AT746_06990 [Lacimicrobium alkaliphilum]
MSGLRLHQIYPPFDWCKESTLSGFLHTLPGPAVLHIPGKNTAITRVVVTLLHGNEPSGLNAIHRILSEGYEPRVNIKVIIASVVAAKTEPVFSHRMLPGQRDLNRCFSAGEKDLQSEIAMAIKEQIIRMTPESVVDLHNTSGSGPAFCVSTQSQEQHIALASHFSHRMILTDIILGSLMEQKLGCPVITVESGGAQDDVADEVAYNGLLSFMDAENAFYRKQHVELLNLPRRVELAKDRSIAYADSAQPDKDITLRRDIEKYNFGETPQDTCLGWIKENSLDALKLDRHPHRLEQWFYLNDHCLMTKRPLRLFMVTTNATIAASDCLFYVVDN